MTAILLVLTLFVVVPIVVGHFIYVGSNEGASLRAPPAYGHQRGRAGGKLQVMPPRA